jgi:lipopolysaccharide O-acetyltransferase
MLLYFTILLEFSYGIKKQKLSMALNKLYKTIFHFPPVRIKKIGTNTCIYRPRKIDGSRSIEIGNNTSIGKYGWLSAIELYGDDRFSPLLRIGNDVYIGRYVCITCISKVHIADGCVLSEHVYIADSSHGLDPRAGPIMKQKLLHKGDVHIGEDTFIGYRACIMPGVTLGKHCVVGANSVVTRSFEDYSMVAGTPAKLIKKYCFQENEWISV